MQPLGQARWRGVLAPGSLSPHGIARRTDEASAPAVATARGAEALRRNNGDLLAVLTDKWALRALQQRDSDLTLEPLVAAQLD